ncbi:MAG: class I SAM-dependent methyltransferase [Chloroflexota bacterium]
MTSKDWQLAHDAAARYEEVLVPAILGPFAKALADWADINAIDTVVDVGTGTGAAARYAAGRAGKVIGTDVNPGMLTVAGELPTVDGAPIEWREASAYALPVEDRSVDVVLCSQVLQFLKERTKALNEMKRVLKPGKAAYISLWCDIEQSPYFDALVKTIAEHISEDTAAGLGAAFQLSDADEIRDLVVSADFASVDMEVRTIELQLPPVPEFVPRHIGATPMGAGYKAADEATQQAIVDQMQKRMILYQIEGGIRVPFRSHMIKATKQEQVT